eukprot:CAMPEP_0176425016 /NCGR_PEP_ID=MMETSP0127-20121128/11163_1 /TAXON_ID=938130 /ORGANISM="Platyophrya macrostoma, Strain WH" /LENGTH=74 /DNA_ID=CAMNT_0017806147 /DNA_START=819 /DNA_END=1043 /DNA_ORIENTATION=-
MVEQHTPRPGVPSDSDEDGSEYSDSSSSNEESAAGEQAEDGSDSVIHVANEALQREAREGLQPAHLSTGKGHAK